MAKLLGSPDRRRKIEQNRTRKKGALLETASNPREKKRGAPQTGTSPTRDRRSCRRGLRSVLCGGTVTID